MSTTRWNRLQSLFHRAAELQGEERERFLERECADDPALKERVQALLQSDHRDPQDLAETVRVAARDLAGGTLAPGERVGSFRVVRELGRGGMGAVYLARRVTGDFDQQVALKVLAGMVAAPGAMERFLIERNILAQLDHPGIARLLDGGTLPQGTPWFAMEHVDGAPIDVWCDRQRLTVRKRLEIFLSVCDAVQYAHRRLVVHRDLKPSNLLVTDDGIPKLLDFGIAKLLESGGGESVTTRLGELPMTPEYASPEQVLGEPVTTATDIYQLGLLLYELLSGRRARRLSSHDRREIERTVQQETLPRPSSVIRDDEPDPHGAPPRTADDVAAARRLSPEGLERRLRRDLDTIVLMALRREPERRYASVEQMAGDVRRHLEGLPVIAHGDTLLYRARKFVARRAGLLAATALVVLALVAGLVATTFQARRAQQEARQAEEVTAFLASLLEGAQPDRTKGEDVTVVQLLEQGAERIDQELAGQPEVQARMLGVIAEAYFALGDYARAEQLRRKELEIASSLWGPADPRIGRILRLMGVYQYTGGDHMAARESLEQAMTLHDPGPAGAAERGLTLSSLGLVLRALGEFEEALAVHERSLPLVERSGDRTAIRAAWQNYGNLLLVVRRFGEAADAYQRALSYHDDLETMRAAGLMANLGMATSGAGRPEEGLEHFEGARRIFEKILPSDHPSLAKLYNAIGECSMMLKRYEDAYAMQRRSLDTYEKALGSDHLDVNFALVELGDVLFYSARPEEAEPFYRRALDVVTGSVGGDNIYASYASEKLGTVSLLLGDPAAAEAWLKQALPVQETTLGHRHAATTATRTRLGVALVRQGRLEEARALLREAMETAEQEGVELTDVDRALTEGAWAEYLIATGELDEAEPLLLSSHRVLQDQPNRAHALMALERLRSLYEAMNRPAEAARYALLKRQTSEAMNALRFD